MIVHTSPSEIILGFMLIIAGICVAGIVCVIYDIVTAIRRKRHESSN